MVQNSKVTSHITLGAILGIAPALIIEKNPNHQDYESMYSISSIKVDLNQSKEISSLTFSLKAKPKSQLSDFAKTEVEVSVNLNFLTEKIKEEIKNDMMKKVNLNIKSPIQLKWQKSTMVMCDAEGKLKGDPHILDAEYDILPVEEAAVVNMTENPSTSAQNASA